MQAIDVDLQHMEFALAPSRRRLYLGFEDPSPLLPAQASRLRTEVNNPSANLSVFVRQRSPTVARCRDQNSLSQKLERDTTVKFAVSPIQSGGAQLHRPY